MTESDSKNVSSVIAVSIRENIFEMGVFKAISNKPSKDFTQSNDFGNDKFYKFWIDFQLCEMTSWERHFKKTIIAHTIID